ncbi:hypothetical protein Desgi_3527 [Desulfoscipio gibsoniae DSM 7213]|uniref:Uncharacterized protein n=1 Tax=Desulfoscipio gibsoniae DSM 7213 TaxID=767817 RepID=R4KMR1_9FIRM|nr:hypothetical protein Desgi_3527 [Desulfoscipio gibsoniae DSM 7213]
MPQLPEIISDAGLLSGDKNKHESPSYCSVRGAFA